MTFRDAQAAPGGQQRADGRGQQPHGGRAQVLLDGVAVGVATGLVGAGAAVIAAAVLTAAPGLLAARWKTGQRPASR
ncbi:hypothetical protein ACFUG9_21425 [Streptomyces griseoincarnatus]